jgi:ornithine carbamoyltransferase
MLNITSIAEFTGKELEELVDLGISIKQNPEQYVTHAANKGLVILMEKTSTRTTTSFAAGISELGGWFLNLDWAKSNLTISPLKYEARYLSSNCSIIMARVKLHKTFKELTDHSTVPVINGCDDRFHPSQILADLITIKETAGKLSGVTLTYVGIHNNVVNSMILACKLVGINLRLVTPLINDPSFDEELIQNAKESGLVRWFDTLEEGAKGADFVYTDTWIDMEWFSDDSYAEERERRMQLMMPFQLNRENLGDSNPYIMHDMPVHPGFEISEDLIDDPKSIIFQQAENRLYSAKALILTCLQLS